MEHGEKSFEEVLRIIKVTKVSAGKFVIEEGELGDRFYIILKGRMQVLKAVEEHIDLMMDASSNNDKIYCYLQFLYDHFADVHWQTVPYARQVIAYLNKVKKFKRALQERVTRMIRRRMSASILRLMQAHRGPSQGNSRVHVPSGSEQQLPTSLSFQKITSAD